MIGPRLAEAHDCLRVALIDPGDFTPEYDLALADGLIESGHTVRLIGKHGFREARRPAFRARALLPRSRPSHGAAAARAAIPIDQGDPARIGSRKSCSEHLETGGPTSRIFSGYLCH